ncbi:hypothetical protein [Hymenobacter arizonensis]|uniref:Lipocalin-like domain-containing protein n=1 Tax=Hymenobacter arizonensis TaxID=1227077 RepID=A0A1I6BTC9_HYMAR|nr:hypothetical protein [Hymenobacter arizonensis]SFQ84173.1 hypothetical protein SAMN04515668_5081 [Hymenobacter arizonensis]
MKVNTLPLLVLFLSNCSSNAVDTVESISIKGTWENTNKTAVFYRTLTFADSSATFTSRGDTIYRFNYFIDQPSRTLWLTDIFNKKLSAKILKSNRDSLVLSNLWELDSKQRFSKRK